MSTTKRRLTTLSLQADGTWMIMTTGGTDLAREIVWAEVGTCGKWRIIDERTKLNVATGGPGRPTRTY